MMIIITSKVHETHLAGQVHHHKKQRLKEGEHMFVHPFLGTLFKYKLDSYTTPEFGIPSSLITQRAHLLCHILDER